MKNNLSHKNISYLRYIKLIIAKTKVFTFDNFMKEDESLHVKTFYLIVAHTKMIIDDY